MTCPTTSRQALLDYLKELLRTSTTTLYSLFCLWPVLASLMYSCGLVRGFGCAPASWPAEQLGLRQGFTAGQHLLVEDAVGAPVGQQACGDRLPGLDLGWGRREGGRWPGGRGMRGTPALADLSQSARKIWGLVGGAARRPRS